MACLLLKLALTLPVRTVAGLTCNIETLVALQHADVALEQSSATACVSLESLIHNGECNNTISLVAGGKTEKAYQLYNETHAGNLLTLATFSMSECTCPVLDFGCKQRCSDMKSLRTINSDHRTSIMELHKLRSEAASRVRDEYAFLITAATQLLDRACSDDEEACEFVESLNHASIK